MYAKIIAFTTLFTLAFAAPGGTPGGITNSCNVGQQYCCNSVQNAQSADAKSAIAGLVNVVTGPITGQVGLTCNPISVIGLGSNSCNAQPTCCSGNNFNGLVVVGCSPIAANL